MHLLAAKPGGIVDGSEAVDLGQSAGDIVVLSAADSDLQMLVAARDAIGPDLPSLRLANLMNLAHPYSVDLYVGEVISGARLVIVRLLGGANYWPYGVEQIVKTCRDQQIKLAIVPGDDQPDPELAGLSTLGTDVCHRLWQYCVQGGPANARSLLAYGASLLGEQNETWFEPQLLLRAGLYWPGLEDVSLDDVQKQWQPAAPTAAIVFYRALFQAGNLAPVDALIEGLRNQGLNPLPLYVASLKDAGSAALVDAIFAQTEPQVILNATGFAVSRPNTERAASPLEKPACPVLQVIFAGSDRESWADKSHGLNARDIAMNIALPEVDGRIIARAVSFKSEVTFDAETQYPTIAYEAEADRIDFTCQLAANWVKLRRKKPVDRRLAIIFANYPNKDGRLGNGVGLDAPAGAIVVLQALQGAGYQVGAIPETGDRLIHQLAAGPTNDIGRRAQKSGGIAYPVAAYREFFNHLPAAVQQQITERWGDVEDDPFCVGAQLILPALEFGNIIVGLQPARGYNIDPQASYHDPDLVPPHGYMAFYGWLRDDIGVDAIIHLGKHGNLEWLPGKSNALSQQCFPEAALGPLPHLYPFIVNDPGEGTQAKRRAQAVIIDHLTPPLTRAESYGPLADLELLVDEYYDAVSVDPRRVKLLKEQILELSRDIGLDRDIGIGKKDDDDTALSKLDNYLCELKELQIRDGLHIFGLSPSGRQRRDLLVALARLPRHDGKDGNASIIRGLAIDLGLSVGEDAFDPLACELGAAWAGPKPDVLAKITADSWRSQGDTVERLELLAAALVDGEVIADEGWQITKAVTDTIKTEIAAAVDDCGSREIAALLTGLDGRFVEPGPSGAPTRGRIDVLPTGRNFYSVDSRSVPTPAAWQLGWHSAGLLVDEFRQRHGAWPRHLAISAWGTANMRTGGDDIAQALALMGVQPSWEPASRRVTGFEIMPLSILDRPRVDVTFRISGFFRDAFPAQVDLIDSAARAIAALDEPDNFNPMAARVKVDKARLKTEGYNESDSERLAGARVFGSMPGAYGAGLQALIDEKGWRDDRDLAQAYLVWGGYAYGGGQAGQPTHQQFQQLLSTTEAVIQNQDNREHDLLDSDDYYQFEGGMTAAIRHFSGTQPTVYHNDHSRPENPRIRTLEDEIGRIVRARVVNPKWIAGVMRHGYKGAFEMAATVDYMFAFAATARVVQNHHFDAVFEAYLNDLEVREFLLKHNPAALREMAEKLLEACARELWQPRSNSAQAELAGLAAIEEEWSA